MLTIKNSLLLSIELFSFLLEDFITNGLMLGDTVRVELSSTSNRALNKSWWIILNDILFGLKICLFDGLILCLIWWVIVAWCLLMVELLLSQWRTSLCLWPCILLSFIDNRLLLIILLIIVWWFGLLGSRLGNIPRRLLLLFGIIIRVWSVVILIVVVVAIFIIAWWRILVSIVIIVGGQVIIPTVRGVVVCVPIIILHLVSLIIVQWVLRPYFIVLLLLIISTSIILVFVTIHRHMILCIRLKIVIVFILTSSQLWALPSIRRVRPTIIILLLFFKITLL